jgi:hypothetical protein
MNPILIDVRSARRSRTAAAKAYSENNPLIAAVNRCATQRQIEPGEPLRHPNQVHRLFDSH